jgi:exonuclease III
VEKQSVIDLMSENKVEFIGIQETKKQEFSNVYLEALGGRKQFRWIWLPSKGSAWGILMGLDSDVFEVIRWDINDYSVSREVINKKEKFRCVIVTVYGAAYEEKKQEFIDELYSICLNAQYPFIRGGDFNLVRFMKDKSNNKVDLKWCEKFNEWIDKSNLLEINLLGRCFTWSNNQENATMSHIDRVFCTTDFDAKFPLARARALPKNTSDHVPILLEVGHDGKAKNSRFKLEKWCLQHSEFKEIVKHVWSAQLGVGGGGDNFI